MKSSLFVRWVVINSLVVAFFATGIFYDIITSFVTDQFYMSQSIVGVTIGFMLWAGYISWVVQRDIDYIRPYILKYRTQVVSGKGDDYKDFLTDKFSRRMALMKLGGTILMSLGLIGTVIGISVSFSGINADVIGDAQASSDAIALLVNGLSVAFHTTLVGLGGMMINMINQHMIVQETNRLYTAIVIGE